MLSIGKRHKLSRVARCPHVTYSGRTGAAAIHVMDLEVSIIAHPSRTALGAGSISECCVFRPKQPSSGRLRSLSLRR
jgi:hypothetical protein